MNIINEILTEFVNKKGGINTKKIKMLGNEKYLYAFYTFNKEKEKNLLKRESVLNKNINFNFIIL